MVCKKKPTEDESLTCNTCLTPWHVTCLSIRPQTLAHAAQWDCPDCSFVANPGGPTFAPVNSAFPERSGLVAAIRVIEDDQSLTQQDKAKRRQYLLSGGGQMSTEAANHENAINGGCNDILNLLDERLNCSFCLQLPERPVTTPCGHNFCLKCFQKWVGQGKHTCANCRHAIPAKMASNPRINSSLVTAIRMAKMSKANGFVSPPKVHHFVHNQNRPDKTYTTDRAKKSGKANACSGKIFVTVPPDHFGSIQAENVPDRKQGILVGETWVDRLECR